MDSSKIQKSDAIIPEIDTYIYCLYLFIYLLFTQESTNYFNLSSNNHYNHVSYIRKNGQRNNLFLIFFIYFICLLILLMHFIRAQLFGPSMFSGLTTVSNCSSVKNPSSKADCFKVRPFLLAFLAILEALS